MLTGIMKNDIKLLGTDLRLEKGQLVKLVPATNLPEPKNKFFASPTGTWPDGIKRNPEDSILVTMKDVESLVVEK